VNRSPQLGQALLDGLSAVSTDDVGLPVEHRPGLEYAPQIFHRLSFPAIGACRLVRRRAPLLLGAGLSHTVKQLERSSS